jgi:NADH-quinone oxidoreductase subunit M
MLRLYKRVFFGEVTNEENRGLVDLSGRELAVIVPLVVMIFWIGLYPRPFLSRIEPTAQVFLQRLDQSAARSDPAPAIARAAR